MDATAMLCWGFVLDGEPPASWLPEHEEELSWYQADYNFAVRSGLSADPGWSDEKDKAKHDAWVLWLQEKRRLEESAQCVVERFGYSEEPSWALVVSELRHSTQEAELLGDELPLASLAARTVLFEYCVKMDIQYREPKWLLLAELSN